MQQWQPNQIIKGDRFLIQEVLGGGGFGVAYRAFDRQNQETVVIKTLNQRQQSREDFDRQQEKFREEAKKLGVMRHPHIVKVHELIQEAGLWGMVMEHIDGQDLADCLMDREKLPEAEALGYIQQVGEALIYVHEQGVLHRDIKPANIMLRQSNQKAVLIDFGLAREFTDDKTASMTNAKSEGYAPIEQYDRHGHFGPYTDVYALAATLYHLVTGAPPLPASFRKLNYPLSPPSAMNPQISKPLEAAIMKGLELEQGQRPQSIEEFLRSLGWERRQQPPVQQVIVEPKQPHLYLSSIAKPPESPNKQQVEPISSMALPRNLPNLTRIQFTSVQLDAQGKVLGKPPGIAEVFTEDLGGGISLAMVKIPAGKFTMGSPASEKDRSSDESPQHQVTVPSFYLGQTLVTQAEWQAIMGNNPSRFKGNFKGNGKLPVDSVSWLDAMDFCEKLSKKTGRTYRLPSEAEWEYACRAGTTAPFAFGETITPEFVNYDGNYPYGGAPKGEQRGKTTVVETSQQTHLGYMICMAIYGNGVLMSMLIAIVMPRLMVVLEEI